LFRAVQFENVLLEIGGLAKDAALRVPILRQETRKLARSILAISFSILSKSK
jgi:hypothetical protein